MFKYDYDVIHQYLNSNSKNGNLENGESNENKLNNLESIKFKKNLYEPWFLLVCSGIKTIDARLNTRYR